MKRNLIILLIAIFIGGRSYAFKENGLPGLQLTHLRTEMLEAPVGIDSRLPRLSWELKATDRDLRQSAYQVLVSTSMQKLNAGQGDLWNSGRVESDHSMLVTYSGVALQSRTKCFWKVKVWTNKGE